MDRDLIEKLDRLSPLVTRICQASTSLEKISVLAEEPAVAAFCRKYSLLHLSEEERSLVLSIVAIGQEHALYQGESLSWDAGAQLCKQLRSVDLFYRELGGLIGYHATLLRFLCRPSLRFPVDKARVFAPVGLDLSKRSVEVRQAIYAGIERMEELGEMYPIGGAADRLRLQDELTGAFLPAAFLSFNGSTLLGRLIGDLQVREYVFYKIKKRQITVPIAMMTAENDHHDRILSFFDHHGWFGRKKEKFAFFSQPLVPVVDREGNWVLTAPGIALSKPGGHGVMWKLAKDQGIFSWFAQQGVSKALVRQINNPISAEDYGLLAFIGHGFLHNKRFGFASCERHVQAAEGVNVIVEEQKEEGFSYTLTNIEYCDFATYNIEDLPKEEGGKYSHLPSNTNVLFVDLPSIEQALHHCPIPGMLVNLKKVLVPISEEEHREEEVARLESTMQNMADCFSTIHPSPLGQEEWKNLDTYITFNKRRKTISATKREYNGQGSLLETPEGCFLDMMGNMRELLEEHCLFTLSGEEERVFSHPPFLFHYHPALGPIYEMIGKKLREGKMSHGSEMSLFIAECDISSLEVEGSFHVVAERVMGSFDEAGILHYGEEVGRMVLHNVRVKNAGIDYTQPNVFWKHTIHRKESCRIYLEGFSELFAQDVTLWGDREIRVPHGFRMVVHPGEEFSYTLEPLTIPSWHWEYRFLEDKQLAIEKKQGEIYGCTRGSSDR